VDSYLEMFRNVERLQVVRAKEISVGTNIPIRDHCYYQGVILKQKYKHNLISQKLYFKAMQKLSGKNSKPFPY
jgi:hypothetical protein|tara:strand:+ start:1772 stop:1990 length:219 start_codon:yes stop_codon:yes gene_type:complete